MKITIKRLRQLLAEAMYDAKTFPRQGKPIPTSVISGDRETAQKISDYSSSEDGFKPAASLATNAGLEPAVIGLHGGYEKLREKANKRLPNEIKDAIETAKSLGMTVEFIPRSHPSEEGQVRIHITKQYNNGAKSKSFRNFSMHLLYQRLPPKQPHLMNLENLQQGQGLLRTNGEIFYLDWGFVTEEADESLKSSFPHIRVSLRSIIEAAEKFYNNASQLESLSLYHQIKDKLILEAEDYINLNKENIEFNRTTPREIAKFIFSSSRMAIEFNNARRAILEGLSPEVYNICADYLENFDEQIEYILDDLEETIEDIMYNKGLGEIISEAYVGFPDKPPVKASKFL